MANSTSHSLPWPVKNARFTLPLSFRVAAGTPTDPTTPDTEFSSDGGATFADCAEEITTGGANGMGYLTLTGAETNNNVVLIAAKSANCLTTPAVIFPRVLPILSSGTLSAGSAGGGTLGTVLGYDITGCILRTTGGTGGGGTGGANNQARVIITYTTSTGAFTVAPNWETTPDATTTYDVLITEMAGNSVITRALRPATDGRTAVVDANGLIDANAVKVGPTGSGTAQTAGDIPARLPAALTANGNMKSSLVEILTTALTETSGLLAGAFKKFFNVSTPTGTVNSIPDAVAGAAGGLFIAGTNAATTVTTSFTTTFTGSLTGSVGSVTGAVGSVTGAVGSVTGSVGSIASGGITTASFAAGAINAAAIGADAITDAKVAADVTIASVTGSVGSVTGAVGSVTGNVGGNVVGSVGSVTGNVGGNVVGSVASVVGLTASNLDTTISSRMATYTQPTGFLAATFPTTVASPTNITAGTITTVGTLTNAPPDSAGVTTLLARLPAAFFAGITSLAQWLGLLAGKQVGNSTARTEMRATGAGSGTFDETTDSLEAVRDAGSTGLDAAGVRAAVGLASANLDTQLSTIDADILTRLATSSYTAAPTAIQNADAYLDRASAIDGKTPRQATRYIAAACAGKISGAGTATEIATGLDGATTRVTYTVDADGNRTVVAYD